GRSRARRHNSKPTAVATAIARQRIAPHGAAPSFGSTVATGDSAQLIFSGAIGPACDASLSRAGNLASCDAAPATAEGAVARPAKNEFPPSGFGDVRSSESVAGS